VITQAFLEKNEQKINLFNDIKRPANHFLKNSPRLSLANMQYFTQKRL
jgi:hypothetical protein